ncbi:MAG: hypothetical protein MR279_01425, partial [Bacteroidales bacterium]|nr:hypothetical protein [Bacteroidales bacterium]
DSKSKTKNASKKKAISFERLSIQDKTTSVAVLLTFICQTTATLCGKKEYFTKVLLRKSLLSYIVSPKRVADVHSVTLTLT